MNDWASKLVFQHDFRIYQQQILDKINVLDHPDNSFHIIAPPGSGKTVVAIELLRRVGKPTVVFVPNTSIQLQWKNQVKLFLPSHQKHLIDDIVSLDSKKLKFINIFTYQLISTPDQNNQYLLKAAQQLWQTVLIQNRIVDTVPAALTRISQLKKQNPRGYAQEISKYKRQAKELLLTTDYSKIDSILHKNAKQLIYNLVSFGIETMVLDEAHHLLDYWALTIQSLSLKIPGARLIGLTATPPETASNKQKANYLYLMGKVDYHTPTPAVVKEGNLAPYQDLLYIASPTPKEKSFLQNIQIHFDSFITSLSQTPLFIDFITTEINHAIHHNKWRSFFNKEPLLAIAIVKYLLLSGTHLPREVIVIPEMKKDISLEDWSILLKAYCLNYLKLSNDPSKFKILDDIKAALRPFGYVLTEAGLRTNRSPIDLIFAYSEAKSQAAVNILINEMDSLKDNLRAVVMTDFEKMNVKASSKIRSVLDKEAGGAVGVFNQIAQNPITTHLEPILITGNNILVDADNLPVILTAIQAWETQHGYQFTLTIKDTEYPRIKQLLGVGKDWKTSVYVHLVTELFETGVTKCIVSTRGLIGEGWNSVRLNTLIDLTCVTSSTSINQIRGRSLRLDPSWPEKLANIWYVICLDTSFVKGDQDLIRTIKKQEQFYSIDFQGRIVKGMAHIDQNLFFLFLTKGFNQISSSVVNSKMFQQSRKRGFVRDLWKIGEPYQNIELSGLSLNRSQVHLKTVHSLKKTVKGLSWAVAESLSALSFWYLQNTYNIITFPAFSGYTLQLQQLSLVLFIVAVHVHVGYSFRQLYQNVMVKIPVDNYLKDIALAVIQTLRECKMIDPSIKPEEITISNGLQGKISIEMKNIGTQDSRSINQALSDVLSSVTDQRYLIERSLNRLPLGILSPLWWISYQLLKLLRQTQPTFHPVPDIIATRKKQVQIFSKYWKKYVGGGKVVYTRNHHGATQLLNLRQHNNLDIDKMSYETWQ